MSEKKNKTKVGEVAIYDARQLGVPKNAGAGCSTYLSPCWVPTTFWCRFSDRIKCIHHPADGRLGNLLFHLITKGKVPAFLGSSFAFLGGYSAVAPRLADGASNAEMLPYACGGVLVAGLVYVLMSALISVFGIRRIMRFFPPVVTGTIIISIGLILAPTAISNASQNWLLCLHRAGGDCRLQHLGKRNGRNRSDSAGYSRFLCCGSVHGRGQL